MKCQHCNDNSLDNLCPACAETLKPIRIVEGKTKAIEPLRKDPIEQAKEAAIRRDERERIIKILQRVKVCFVAEVVCSSNCEACMRKALEPPQQEVRV